MLDMSSQPSIKDPMLQSTSLSINALINHPHRSNEQATRPDARSIPPVYLSQLESIVHSQFASYVKPLAYDYETYSTAKGREMRQHLQSSQFKRAGADSVFSGTELLEARLAEQLSASTPLPSQSDQESILSNDLSPISEAGDFDFRERGSPQRVPTLFSDVQFDLKNPRFFDQIIALGQSARHSVDIHKHDAFWDNPVLQDRLSDYIDLLETALIDEITNSGPEFLSTMLITRTLSLSAIQTTEHICTVRSALDLLMSDTTFSGLRSAQLLIRSINVASIRKQLSSVRESAHLLSSMFADNVMSKKTQETVRDLDALSVHCLAPALSNTSIANHMSAIVQQARIRLSQDELERFKDLLIKDLLGGLSSTDATQIYESAYNRHILCIKPLKTQNVLGWYGSEHRILRERLTQCINILSDFQQLDIAILSYREACLKEIKNITKRELPLASDDDDDARSIVSSAAHTRAGEKSAMLAKALGELDASAFLSMLRAIFTKTCIFLANFAQQEKLLVDLVTASTSFDTTKAQSIIYSESHLQRMAEICHIRVVKILNVRSASTTSMSATNFNVFTEICRVFSAECEEITGQTAGPIITTMSTQLKHFYNVQFNHLAQDITTSADLDTWQPFLCSSLVQEACDSLYGCKITSSSDVINVHQELLAGLNGELRHTLIDQNSFQLNRSLAALLIVLAKLQFFCHTFASMRSDITSNIVGLVRFYNNKTQQLILGAVATKSAGLERITAKHLASASQALLLLVRVLQVYLIPFKLWSTTAMSLDFANLRDELILHRNSIHDKLITIMEERTKTTCVILGELFEQVKEAHTEPSSPIVALVKDTLVLSRVLGKFLDKDSLQDIMDRVIKLEETQLVTIYRARPEISAQAAIDRKFYLDRLADTSKMVGTVLLS